MASCLAAPTSPLERSATLLATCSCLIRFLDCGVLRQFNFVGRLLGPRGLTLKRMQSETGCRMTIMGRGSVRDPIKVRWTRLVPGMKVCPANRHSGLKVAHTSGRFFVVVLTCFFFCVCLVLQLCSCNQLSYNSVVQCISKRSMSQSFEWKNDMYSCPFASSPALWSRAVEKEWLHVGEVWFQRLRIGFCFFFLFRNSNLYRNLHVDVHNHLYFLTKMVWWRIWIHCNSKRVLWRMAGPTALGNNENRKKIKPGRMRKRMCQIIVLQLVTWI